MAAEAILRRHGVEEGEKIVYGKLLTEPITPAERTDAEALEERRLALLEEAKDIQNLNSRVKRTHQAADKEYKETLRLKKAFEEKLVTGEALRKKYETHVKYAEESPEEFRELIKPRKLNFDGPSNRKVLPTPKGNMFKAAEILKENDDKIDLDLLRQIVGTAVKQQSKADTMPRMASDPELCQSTARAEPKTRSRDNHSRTASPEGRRKEGTNRDNPIHVPSTARDKDNGKRPVLSDRDQYHKKPPMPEKRRDPTPHRQTGYAGN